MWDKIKCVNQALVRSRVIRRSVYIIHAVSLIMMRVTRGVCVWQTPQRTLLAKGLNLKRQTEYNPFQADVYER